MDKLLKIKAIQPNNTQLLIRTDIETGNWFIHLYTKERSVETGNLLKDESIFRGYYSDNEIDKVLDSIIEWCLVKEK